ncbi:MAG: peptidylprolyl isomerase [Myxococcota bacterium]|nr:peptidylprolyl isomerase [Myxococcota bacterium]
MKYATKFGLASIVALVMFNSCKSQADRKEPSPSAPTPSASQKSAAKAPTATVPDKFAVKLETAKGDIVIDVHKAWAPEGAKRFYTLVKEGFYTDVAFFRVIAGFMAQTGLSGDPARNAEWREKKIPDDPVKKSNTPGMVSFATSGPNSRTTQFFINFGDNSRLDKMGFAPFGKVRDMKPVTALYNGYGEGAPRGMGPSQGRIQKMGNTYLKKQFPKLDYILKATILTP